MTNLKLSAISDNRLTAARLTMTAISTTLFLVSLVLIGLKGFNWGLDFTGGVVAEIQVHSNLILEDFKPLLDQLLIQDVQVISSSEAGQWIVRFSQTDEHVVALNEVFSHLPFTVEIINSSVVGPQVGQEMVEQGGLAIMACLLLTMIYLSCRFEWRLALGALVALLQDVVIVLGLFALMQWEFNLTILAAVLAVLGYSLNDSIVIADRVRELFRANPNGQADLLINDAIRATFSRTLVTSGTTLVTVSSLWLLGGATLEGFAVALCVGIVCGTWSSVSVGVSLPKLLGVAPIHFQPQIVDLEENTL
jgi:preprotein translocase subunit SecF